LTSHGQEAMVAQIVSMWNSCEWIWVQVLCMPLV